MQRSHKTYTCLRICQHDDHGRGLHPEDRRQGRPVRRSSNPSWHAQAESLSVFFSEYYIKLNRFRSSGLLFIYSIFFTCFLLIFYFTYFLLICCFYLLHLCIFILFYSFCFSYFRTRDSHCTSSPSLCQSRLIHTRTCTKIHAHARTERASKRERERKRKRFQPMHWIDELLHLDVVLALRRGKLHSKVKIHLANKWGHQYAVTVLRHGTLPFKSPPVPNPRTHSGAETQTNSLLQLPLCVSIFLSLALFDHPAPSPFSPSPPHLCHKHRTGFKTFAREEIREEISKPKSIETDATWSLNDSSLATTKPVLFCVPASLFLFFMFQCDDFHAVNIASLCAAPALPGGNRQQFAQEGTYGGGVRNRR